MKPTDVTDWRIVLQPVDQKVQTDGHGTVMLFSGDEKDATDQLELMVQTIKQLGHVPDTGFDWRNKSPCGITKQQGRFTYRVRCDSFERETETGSTSGAGWLRCYRVVE